ncbi:MAG: GIY-YIG nuclease family protein [Acetatifactor sp.]|nr:GIY-YIG nuclease family protein [Lachnospiraceae bacterium]MDE5950891.1 GIY-YIG nuclease family protein [Acetatifactor sp.]
MSEKNGVIYILTNPSFPEYVKIGYADNIDKRLKQLNRSECIPFAFRVYATYEVSSRLSDLKIHSIIDKLNPNLRSVENFNGKRRVREFYAMAPEDAYSILEAIAVIHGCGDKLKIAALSEEEKAAEQTAQEIDTESTERAANFSFSKCQIPVGAKIEYYDNPNITAMVVDDRNVEYNGETMSLTALAKLLSGKKYSIAGPKFFKYKGEWLNDIRHRLGV